MDKKEKQFFNLVKDQFIYGAKKYGVRDNQSRESTDILCDDFGINGLLWTVGKYHFRYEMQGREKDLLKIGCYMYLLWLKFGFYLMPEGTEQIQDTGIEQKERNFAKFEKEVNECKDVSPVDNIQTSYQNVCLLNQNKFILGKRRIKYVIYQAFHIIMNTWIKDFGGKEKHDTDTWNK